MNIRRYKRSRFWGVYEADGTLLCLCVYKKGANSVLQRLLSMNETPPLPSLLPPCEAQSPAPFLPSALPQYRE